MKSRSQNMISGPLFGSIVSYTIPIILTSLLQLLFHAADLVVVGRFCGSISVAAVGSTGAITNLIVNLFVGLSVGGGVCMAHAIGSRDREAMHRTVHTLLPTALVSGLVLTVVGVSCSRTFLTWMDTPEDVLPLSAQYMRIYFWGISFSMIYNFCSAVLRAAGDTRGPLVYLTVAGVTNVILNLIFVTVLHMDVAGVALATIISQGISAILVVLAMMRTEEGWKLELKKMRFYRQPLLKLIALGLPAGIQGSMFSISNVIIQSSINSFGPVFMSGNAAAGNIEGFVYASMNAFHQTALNFTGQNAGAGQYKRISRLYGICLACVTAVGITMGSAVYGFAPKLLQIYITDSQEAIAYAVERMAYICLPYFFLGMMDVTTGVLRGLGSSLTPTLISVVGVCGFRILWIATVFQLPQFHTPQCLYLSYLTSWIITLLGQIIAYRIAFRKKEEEYRRLLARPEIRVPAE